MDAYFVSAFSYLDLSGGDKGIVLQWVQSYLEKRHKYVEFNYHKSSNLNIICGIPQGQN